MNAMPMPASPRAIPHRTASRRSSDILREFHNPIESKKVATQTAVIAAAIRLQTAMLKGVETLKWLVDATEAMPTITASSTSNITAMRFPSLDARPLPFSTKVKSQENVAEYKVAEIRNFRGFSQIDTPRSSRGSITNSNRATIEPTRLVRAATLSILWPSKATNVFTSRIITARV